MTQARKAWTYGNGHWNEYYKAMGSGYEERQRSEP